MIEINLLRATTDNQVNYENLKDEELKYELTKETKKIGNHVLFRVRALKDFNDVRAGDLGGFIEHLNSLSQKGNCWIYDDACLYGNAYITKNARVSGNAQIYENAGASDEVKVYGYAQVYGFARILGNSKVYGDSKVYDYAQITEDSKVYGDAIVKGEIYVSGNADIFDKKHIMSFLGLGEDSVELEAFKTTDGALIRYVGCIYTVDDFVDNVYEEYHGTEYLDEFKALMFLINIRFEVEYDVEL